MSLYYLGNHRTDEQLAEMVRLEAEGICLFCPQHIVRCDPRPEHRTPHWTIVANAFPYRGARLHYLLVPDEHVADMVDLSPAAQHDFWSALAWLREQHHLAYYGVAVRNGDCEHTGGTVRHLHVHVIQGDVDDPDHEPVRFKLSSRARD